MSYRLHITVTQLAPPHMASSLTQTRQFSAPVHDAPGAMQALTREACLGGLFDIGGCVHVTVQREPMGDAGL